ncbi:MAG TPA: hypothetical protein VMZ92_21145 [Planctomycetota bacterium]|nr:hypothetical protein [Planctomycetota bacterium]
MRTLVVSALLVLALGLSVVFASCLVSFLVLPHPTADGSEADILGALVTGVLLVPAFGGIFVMVRPERRG